MKAQLICSSLIGASSAARGRGTLITSAIAFAILGAATAPAQPSWYDAGSDSGIQPGSPDFYQHQISGTYANEGFCDFFAYEDAMWYDHNNGFPNLYANGTGWVDAMVNNFTNIYLSTSGFNAPASSPPFMNTYILSQGYTNQLGMVPYQNPRSNSLAFSNLRNNLLAGSNVLVRIELTNATYTVSNQWWGYHVMDVVGFSSSNNTMVVLDPDNTRYGASGLPLTFAPGYLTNNFGVGVPYNLVYNTNSQPFPEETGWGDVGNPTNSLLQAYQLSADGTILNGIYAGTQVTWLYDIGPVPEPSVAALALVAATTLGAWRWTRRKEKARNAPIA